VASFLTEGCTLSEDHATVDPRPRRPIRSGDALLVGVLFIGLLAGLVVVTWGQPVDSRLGLGAFAGLVLLVAICLGIAFARSRRSEARYRMLVERVSDAVLVADASGRLLDANAAACSLLGYTRLEILGQPVPDLGLPAASPGWASRPGKADADGAGFSEGVACRRDGSLMTVEVRPGRLPDGSFYTIVRDVTARKAAEAERDRFAAAVEQTRDIVHDLNNLLGTVRGYTELTHGAAHPGDEVHSFTAEVLKASDRARILTHRLLSFARFEWRFPSSERGGEGPTASSATQASGPPGVLSVRLIDEDPPVRVPGADYLVGSTPPTT
jgi:PAS domain S-box-containing protein